MLHTFEIVAAGLFALLGAWFILLLLARRVQEGVDVPTSARQGTAVFLFEAGELVDASPAARRFLEAFSSPTPTLATLTAFLSQGFGPNLDERIASLPQAGRFRLDSLTGDRSLEVEEHEGAFRVTLHLEGDGEAGLDRLSLEAAREELALLRGIVEDAPEPIWALDMAGQLAWANRAYLELADGKGGEGAADSASGRRTTWPAAPAFESPSGLAEGQVQRARVPLILTDRKEPLWFDVTSLGRVGGSLHFAVDVGNLVQAEAARLHFVQALAKTFADLPTGLAIFDRDRRLALFNPAFVDLTNLPVAFLSGRPLVHSVLDRLREAKILPEPRNYASWREEVSALEAAAAQGAYSDVWALSSGRSYRVTGRPHPDGALAFLFEDITHEVGEARRFRGEIEAMRAVIDGLEEAVAVFAADGALMLSNASYDSFWGAPPASGGDLAGEMRRWEAACQPSSAWELLRQESHGTPREVTVQQGDGRCLRLRLVQLPQGARLATILAERMVGPADDTRKAAQPAPSC